MTAERELADAQRVAAYEADIADQAIAALEASQRELLELRRRSDAELADYRSRFTRLSDWIQGQGALDPQAVREALAA